MLTRSIEQPSRLLRRLRGIPSSVSQASQLSRGEDAIIRAGKSNEQGTGDFHACLYSLRDHPHGSDWSRRLLGSPRKGRCPRALEARLNGAEIASNIFSLHVYPLGKTSPGRVSSVGAFFAFLCRRTRAQCCITHA